MPFLVIPRPLQTDVICGIVRYGDKIDRETGYINDKVAGFFGREGLVIDAIGTWTPD
jgi:hypothetical protein